MRFFQDLTRALETLWELWYWPHFTRWMPSQVLWTCLLGRKGTLKPSCSRLWFAWNKQAPFPKLSHVYSTKNKNNKGCFICACCFYFSHLWSASLPFVSKSLLKNALWFVSKSPLGCFCDRFLLGEVVSLLETVLVNVLLGREKQKELSIVNN